MQTPPQSCLPNELCILFQAINALSWEWRFRGWDYWIRYWNEGICNNALQFLCISMLWNLISIFKFSMGLVVLKQCLKLFSIERRLFSVPARTATVTTSRYRNLEVLIHWRRQGTCSYTPIHVPVCLFPCIPYDPLWYIYDTFCFHLCYSPAIIITFH